MAARAAPAAAGASALRLKNKKGARRELLQAPQTAQRRAEEGGRAREVFLAAWDESVARVLVRPCRPLEEVFTVTGAKAAARAFAPAVRASLLGALTAAGSAHDTCVAFQVLDGHKRRRALPLLQWYEEFCAATDGGDGEEMRARFLQSSLELQALGVCRPSARGSDKVIKLVHNA